MKIGISAALSHNCPEEWARNHKEAGCESVVFPVDYKSEERVIEAYAKAAKEWGLTIAEVGVWCNPMAEEENRRNAAMERCVEQLRMADRVGAGCCVNVVGAVTGMRWDGGCAENFSEEAWDKIIVTTQRIIDTAKPVNTFYSLEPMPWMVPTGPEEYLKLLNDVDRKQFGVHMDVVNMITDPNRYFFNKDFIEKCFDLLGPYIKSCHLKDVKLGEEFTFCLRETSCGDGCLDLEYYVKRANEANENMPMIIEHLNTQEEYLDSLLRVQKRLNKEVR